MSGTKTNKFFLAIFLRGVKSLGLDSGSGFLQVCCQEKVGVWYRHQLPRLFTHLSSIAVLVQCALHCLLVHCIAWYHQLPRLFSHLSSIAHCLHCLCIALHHIALLVQRLCIACFRHQLSCLFAHLSSLAYCTAINSISWVHFVQSQSQSLIESFYHKNIIRAGLLATQMKTIDYGSGKKDGI